MLSLPDLIKLASALNLERMLSQYGLYLTTYVVAVVSGFVPVVNIELYLIWVAALTSRSQGVPLTVLATLGQMTAKTLMYLSGAGILKISLKKPGEKMAAIQRKLESWQNRVSLFIFLSAFTGFPPFYVVSVASGAFKVKFLRFLIPGLAGRLLRFAIAVFLPHLVKGFLH